VGEQVHAQRRQPTRDGLEPVRAVRGHVVALRVALLGVELVSDRADQAVDLVDEIRLGFHGNYLPVGAAAVI
jgi:hypothetical protein